MDDTARLLGAFVQVAVGIFSAAGLMASIYIISSLIADRVAYTKGIAGEPSMKTIFLRVAGAALALNVAVSGFRVLMSLWEIG